MSEGKNSINMQILSEMKALSQPGDSFFSDLINLFFQTTDKEMIVIRQQMAEKNLEELKRVSHKLKSSCGNLGLDKMSDMCRGLENNPENWPEAEKLLSQLESEYIQVKAELKNLLAGA